MAGRVQLAAIGTADEVLTGLPEITFWKAVYKRHTPFAMESVALTWHGTTDFGRRATCIVPRTADLISKLWLQITLPDISNLLVQPAGVGRIVWANSIAYVLVSSIQVEIGGTTIDKHDGAFMDAMSQLHVPNERRRALNEMIGRYDAYDPSDPLHSFNTSRILYLPIQFYFSKYPDYALPLIALSFSEVRVNLELRNFMECIRSTLMPVSYVTTATGSTPSLVDVTLYADMVYLDRKEASLFSQIDHETLIEVTQSLGDQPSVINAPTARIDLFLSQPVKYIMWVFLNRDNQVVDTLNGNRWFDWQTDIFDLCGMQINGSDRFKPRPGSYFRLVQPDQHFPGCPDKNVHVYSFALHADQAMPSGTANFSRLEGSQLVLNLTPNAPNGVVKVYAVSYQILRISNGYAQISYAS